MLRLGHTALPGQLECGTSAQVRPALSRLLQQAPFSDRQCWAAGAGNRTHQRASTTPCAALGTSRRGSRRPGGTPTPPRVEQQRQEAEEWAAQFLDALSGPDSGQQSKQQERAHHAEPASASSANTAPASASSATAAPTSSSTPAATANTRTGAAPAAVDVRAAPYVGEAPPAVIGGGQRQPRKPQAGRVGGGGGSRGGRGAGKQQEGERRRPGAGEGGGTRGGRGAAAQDGSPKRAERRPAPLVQRGAGGGAGGADFFAQSSFESLGASAEVIEALQQLGVRRPSHVQAKSFEAFEAGAKYVALADRAGSGKTLAYLLPLVQAMRAEEAAAGRRVTRPRAPRAVVVVPTEELAAQLLRVCRSLSQLLRFRVVAVTGMGKLRTQQAFLDEGVDVLVATPGRLQKLLGLGSLELRDCAALVLDEVDVLLGDTAQFAEQVAPLCDAAGPGTRLVFVTATLPEYTWQQLQDTFPGIMMAAGPGLHRCAVGVTEQLVDCSGGDEINQDTGFARKATALLAVLQEQRAARAIVFCNKIDTCRKVENLLTRRYRSGSDNVMVLPYHAAIAEELRGTNLNRFLAPPREEQRMILVCTDRASRGVDSAYVEHVVLFDWPRDPSEYVRRVGRTARGAGGQGTVSVLVLGRQVPVAKEVISRNQKGQPIHMLPDVVPSAHVQKLGEAGGLQGPEQGDGAVTEGDGVH